MGIIKSFLDIFAGIRLLQLGVVLVIFILKILTFTDSIGIVICQKIISEMFFLPYASRTSHTNECVPEAKTVNNLHQTYTRWGKQKKKKQREKKSLQNRTMRAIHSNLFVSLSEQYHSCVFFCLIVYFTAFILAPYSS